MCEFVEFTGLKSERQVHMRGLLRTLAFFECKTGKPCSKIKTLIEEEQYTYPEAIRRKYS